MGRIIQHTLEVRRGKCRRIGVGKRFHLLGCQGCLVGATGSCARNILPDNGKNLPEGEPFKSEYDLYAGLPADPADLFEVPAQETLLDDLAGVWYLGKIARHIVNARKVCCG